MTVEVSSLLFESVTQLHLWLDTEELSGAETSLRIADSHKTSLLVIIGNLYSFTHWLHVTSFTVSWPECTMHPKN